MFRMNCDATHSRTGGWPVFKQFAVGNIGECFFSPALMTLDSHHELQTMSFRDNIPSTEDAPIHVDIGWTQKGFSSTIEDYKDRGLLDECVPTVLPVAANYLADGVEEKFTRNFRLSREMQAKFIVIRSPIANFLVEIGMKLQLEIMANFHILAPAPKSKSELEI